LNGTADLDLPVIREDVDRIAREHKARPKRPHRKSHGKISFLELARQIAARWKKIDASTKRIFEAQAIYEKEDYAQRFQEWKEYDESRREATTANTGPEENVQQLGTAVCPSNGTSSGGLLNMIQPQGTFSLFPQQQEQCPNPQGGLDASLQSLLQMREHIEREIAALSLQQQRQQNALLSAPLGAQQQQSLLRAGLQQQSLVLSQPQYGGSNNNFGLADLEPRLFAESNERNERAPVPPRSQASMPQDDNNLNLSSPALFFENTAFDSTENSDSGTGGNFFESI